VFCRSVNFYVLPGNVRIQNTNNKPCSDSQQLGAQFQVRCVYVICLLCGLDGLPAALPIVLICIVCMRIQQSVCLTLSQHCLMQLMHWRWPWHVPLAFLSSSCSCIYASNLAHHAFPSGFHLHLAFPALTICLVFVFQVLRFSLTK